MDNSYKFRRLFLIFDKEDAGFGEGGDPEGYVKIEVRDGKGKLNCHVSNLKEESSKMEYVLYIMKLDETEAIPCFAGIIPVKENKGELYWEFDPLNVGRTGLPLDEFNAAALLVQYKNRPYDSIISPLAALKDNKTGWRNKLLKYFREKESDSKDDRKFNNNDNFTAYKKEDITSKYVNDIESKFTRYSFLGDSEGSERVSENKDTDIKESIPEEKNSTDRIDSVNLMQKSFDNNTKRDQTVQIDMEQAKQESDSADVAEMSTAPKEEIPDIPSTNNNTRGDFSDANSKKQDACKTGISNIGMVAERFDKFFVKDNPFMTERKDYKWWRVASPVHLNNILYQLNIKVPVLFNPQVLMAHFKYRHLIVGTYRGEDGAEFIVCGIPSVYWVDEKPFANVCRWAQVEGNTPKYGAFGYWLVYVDPKTGKILSAG